MTKTSRLDSSSSSRTLSSSSSSAFLSAMSRGDGWDGRPDLQLGAEPRSGGIPGPSGPPVVAHRTPHNTIDPAAQGFRPLQRRELEMDHDEHILNHVVDDVARGTEVSGRRPHKVEIFLVDGLEGRHGKGRNVWSRICMGRDSRNLRGRFASHHHLLPKMQWHADLLSVTGPTPVRARQSTRPVRTGTPILSLSRRSGGGIARFLHPRPRADSASLQDGGEPGGRRPRPFPLRVACLEQYSVQCRSQTLAAPPQ